MAVVDASVLVDALVGLGERAEHARRELRAHSILPVPAIFTAEATSALRALLLRGAISPPRAATALAQVRSVRITAYPFEPFVVRAWELRDNLTVYDAWYVALAESLGADFVTADARLLEAVGPRCTVRQPGSSR